MNIVFFIKLGAQNNVYLPLNEVIIDYYTMALRVDVIQT